MDFALSTEQQLLIRSARAFVERDLRPHEDQIEKSGAMSPDLAHELTTKGLAAGLYATNIPEEHGGGGLSTLDWMLIEEEAGKTSDILARRAFGNVYEILLAGTRAQHERWLHPAVRGEITVSVAFTEPDAGSDAASIKTKAVRAGDSWKINGQKHFVSDGFFSDAFVITAITDPSVRKQGISAFIIDKDMDGVDLGRDQPMMGLRGTTHGEIFLNDVHVDRDRLLGEEGQGLSLALSTLGRIRLAQIGARAIGKAVRIMDLTLEHARERRQFGQAIGDFQMVQQMLADSAIEINAARLALHHAAFEVDRSGDTPTTRGLISMVKVQAAEMLGRVADRAVQIFGGMGYCRDLPIERYYRDARIFRIFDGTSEIHRGVVARQLMNDAGGLYDPGNR